MESLRLEVPEDLYERLTAETDLLGFESREAYVQWVLRHRATMEGDAERNRILAAYARRVEELERRIAESDADVAADPDRDDEESVLEANLAPATDRITDDTVSEVADELAGVEGDRVDEIARQAVARTREQLGDGPGTGLSYRSQTSIGDGPRPGSDIADLDDIEVPGYDDELVERRRVAVGAALAYLKDAGEARRAEFVEALYDEYPAGYDSEDGWWGCLKRGLRQVDRVDDAGEGSRTWRFRDVRGRVRVFRESS